MIISDMVFEWWDWRMATLKIEVGAFVCQANERRGMSNQ
jgi:hypothetical protein